MSFENLRAVLATFDSPHATAWRRLELRRILAESSIPPAQQEFFERALGGAAGRAVGELLVARSLSGFAPHMLSALEPVLEDHLDGYLDRAKGVRRPVARDDLREAIELHDLGSCLREKVEVLGSSSWAWALRRLHGYDTVGEIAFAQLSRRSASTVHEARSRARSWLDGCIDNDRKTRALERSHAELEARSVPPALAKLDAQLAALVPKKVTLRARGTYQLGEVAFVEPSWLVYSESVAGKPRELVALDLAGDAPRMEQRRSKKGELAAVIPVAIAAARRLLRDESSAGHDAILRLASTPSWTRAFDAIGAAFEKQTPGHEWSFLLKRTKTSLTLTTGVIESSLEGRRFVSKMRVYACPSTNRDDARVARALDRSSFSTMDDLLGALVGHPRVYLASSPIRVERARTVLRARADDREVHLELLLGDTPIDGSHLVADGIAVLIDEVAQVLRFAALDERELALLRTFACHGSKLPAEARTLLLPKLEHLAPRTEVQLLGNFAGRAVPPACEPVARLDARAWPDVMLSLRVRPLACCVLQVPGEGPSQLRGVDEGEPIHTIRDLDGERAAFERLSATLGLDASVDTWALRPLDRAVEILSALRTTEGVTLEWIGPAVQVFAPIRRSELRVQIEEKRGWFEIGADVAVDQHRLSLALLLEAARSEQRYVTIAPGKLVELEAELRARLLALADHVRPNRSGALEVTATAAPVVAPLAPEAPPSFARVLERLETAHQREPRVPRHLAKVLRPYQRDGYTWLARLAAWGAGGLLADDMGLGKTVQTIALLCARADEGPAMVVAPTSVVGNWASELSRFGNGLRAIDYRSAGRDGVLCTLRTGDVLLVSYDLLVRDIESFAGVRFGTLVVDEAQAAKNAQTQRARALRAVERDVCFALTGTPIENHLGELWSILSIASPGLLGSWDSFRERFAEPIEVRADATARASLSRLLRPFLLRRTKEAVAPELPPLTEVVRRVEMQPEERAGYESARRTALARMAGMIDDPRGRISALAELMRLRRLACHPQLVDAESAIASAKLESALELLDEIVERGHRALVFSQFVDHLALVRRALDARGVRYLYLDGRTPAPERPGLVAAFQTGDMPLFLISVRAGGTGLNLTGADYVLHLDPWWNPAVEDQATDRAHRIGQTRPVTVVRLVAIKTIEEAVVSLHETKRALAESLLEGADTAARLSVRELSDLVRGSDESGSTTASLTRGSSRTVRSGHR